MPEKQELIRWIKTGQFDPGRAARFDIDRARGSLESSFAVERVTEIDEDGRTVEFAFATDQAIEHWFGYLILDVKKSSVILDRVEAGVCPNLVNHNRDKQCGVVVPGTVSLGSTIRGKVRFSRSTLGEEIFTDVKDEIRNGGSIGLLVHDIILEKDEKNGIPTYRATKWEFLEYSIASVPADIACGPGRSLDPQHPEKFLKPAQIERAISTKEENEMTPEEIAAANAAAEAQRAQEQSAARRSEIVAFADIYGEGELAREMMLASDDLTVDDVRVAIRDKRQAAAAQQQQPPPESPASAAARQGGGTGIELARSVNRFGALKAFRGENGAQQAYRFGQFVRAALFGVEQAAAYCRQNGIEIRRAHSESDNETGGYLVPTEFENVMIDLRLEYGVFRRNANVVPMMSNSKERPRRTGGLTAYPIGARGTNRRLTESRKGWDRVGLDAKKWGVLAKYEEELADDAVINIGDDLASEMSYSFTEVEDDCGFNGDGSSDFHGIVGVIPKLTGLNGTVGNIAGLVEATGNLWSEIVLIDILTMVGRLPSFARRTGQVKWYCTSEFWATVLCRIALGLGGSAVADIQNDLGSRFLGKPVEFVEVLPHTEANSQVCLLYGNLSQGAMFGDRRGVTIKTTDSNDTDFEEDLIAIKGTERFDINVHDVGNASATAADRQAGPIVGLITKSS